MFFLKLKVAKRKLLFYVWCSCFFRNWNLQKENCYFMFVVHVFLEIEICKKKIVILCFPELTGMCIVPKLMCYSWCFEISIMGYSYFIYSLGLCLRSVSLSDIWICSQPFISIIFVEIIVVVLIFHDLHVNSIILPTIFRFKHGTKMQVE